MKRYYIYLVANKKDGNIYAGSTDNLIRRVSEHKNNSIDGYTKNRGINILVYYEEHNNFQEAIRRERQIKKWKREWKIKLIEKFNPEWNDLYNELLQNNK